MARSKSSSGWLAEHFTDEFVKRARKEGYRSRAVYKLKELDERDRLLRPGMTVVDLGAAPGALCQYLRERLGKGGRVVGLDLLPIEPLAGVELLQGDFTDEATLNALLATLGGQRPELVMSDMAPNITGVAAADQARAIHLAELALAFCDQALKPGGTLLIKVFQGAGFPELRREMLARFERLVTRKPRASRVESREIYLLGRGWRAA